MLLDTFESVFSGDLLESRRHAGDFEVTALARECSLTFFIVGAGGADSRRGVRSRLYPDWGAPGARWEACAAESLIA